MQSQKERMEGGGAAPLSVARKPVIKARCLLEQGTSPQTHIHMCFLETLYSN